MTVFDWIVTGIAIAAAMLLVWLLSRHWKKVLLIDVDAMPKAKLRTKKYQLIEGRLQRKFQTSFQKFAPVFDAIAARFQKFHGKLVALERKYRHASRLPRTQEDKEKTRQKIASLMEQGTEFTKQEQYAEAEAIFLEVIRMNPKEVEAYEYLGELYTVKHEYDHAIETLKFAKNLAPNEDRIYYDLGMVHRTQGNADEALACLQKCVELAPNNPKNLDALLELAIELKKKELAQQLLAQFKEANPENEKISEFANSIKQL